MQNLAMAGFCKAAQPLGVAADRFEGLAQGKKRAQAGSGTAAEVPRVDADKDVRRGTGETTSAEFLERCSPR